MTIWSTISTRLGTTTGLRGKEHLVSYKYINFTKNWSMGVNGVKTFFSRKAEVFIVKVK